MSKPLHINGFWPDPHQIRIDEYFSSIPAEMEGIISTFKYIEQVRLIYFICFTNRCGSNLLAQSLASDGQLKQAGENLNFDTVIAQSERHNLRTFKSYFNWLIGHRTGKQKIFGCKCSPGQLLYLHNTGLLDVIRSKSIFIHLTRKDIFDQAISMYIAERTKKWTSTQSGVQIPIIYDHESLMKTAENILRANSAFALIFQLLNLKVINVTYDGLVRDPRLLIGRIGKHLGISDLKYNESTVVYAKQSNELNIELKNKLLSEYI
jgi:LPS sulfotransferase NodH